MRSPPAPQPTEMPIQAPRPGPLPGGCAADVETVEGAGGAVEETPDDATEVTMSADNGDGVTLGGVLEPEGKTPDDAAWEVKPSGAVSESEEEGSVSSRAELV